MADDSKFFAFDQAILANHDVRDLAKLAVDRVANGNDLPLPRPDALEERLGVLCDAFLANSNEAHHQVIQKMRRNGVPTSEIIDYVIPEAAAILGQRWADDALSFVEVTIGTARLQEAVRGLIAHETSRATMGEQGKTTNADPGRIHTPRVLLVIPRPEHHTLGAFVAADQFRRYGYEVDIAVDQHPKQITVPLTERNYCMVGISVAGRRTLASSRELVDIIRSTVTRVTPIVLGGSLLEADDELKKATGVDHVARSVRDALELCGLSITEADPPQDLMVNHC